MASNIVAKLLLDDKDYSSKLDKAKKNSKSFSQEVSTGMTKAVGGLTAALGLAGGAFVTMNKAIQSSQKTADGFDKVMRAANTTVNAFFTSLSTGDLSSFNQGLGNLINQAKAAASALDQLGNTRISYNYFNSANQADFNEALNTLRDNSAGSGAKASAKATADAILGNQKDITDALRTNVQNAVAALAAEGNGLSYSVEDIRSVLGIDVGVGPSRSAMDTRYKEYLAKQSDIFNSPVYKEEAGILKGTKKYTVDENAQSARLNALKAEYKDAIVYNKLLQQMSDEQLQQLVSLMVEAENADRAYQSMSRSLIKINNQLGNGSSTTPTPFANYQNVGIGSGAGLDYAAFGASNASAAKTRKDNIPYLDFSLPNAQPYVESMTNLADAGEDAYASMLGLAGVMSNLNTMMYGGKESWLTWASMALQIASSFASAGIFGGVAGATGAGAVNFKIAGKDLVGVLSNVTSVLAR